MLNKSQLSRKPRLIFVPSDFELTLKYARQECELNQKQKDGCSLKEQLLSVERQTKKTPKQLQDLIELPESCYRPWRHFIALDSTRTSNGYSVNPISYTEMKSYFDLIGEVPDRWEVEIISKIDRTILEVYAKQAEREMNLSKK